MSKKKLYTIITIVAILSLLLAGSASAHNPRVPGEVCKSVSNGHGTLCTINGVWHSIRCQTGYKVFPSGRGTSCVKKVTRGQFQWEAYQ